MLIKKSTNNNHHSGNRKSERGAFVDALSENVDASIRHPHDSEDWWPPCQQSSSDCTESSISSRNSSSAASFSSAPSFSDDESSPGALTTEDEEEDTEGQDKTAFYFEDPSTTIENENEVKEDADEEPEAASLGNGNHGRRSSATITGELMEIGAVAIVAVIGFFVVFALGVMVGESRAAATARERDESPRDAARCYWDTGRAAAAAATRGRYSSQDHYHSHHGGGGAFDGYRGRHYYYSGSYQRRTMSDW